MERTSIRAWRRIQKKRVWRNRLRHLYWTFSNASRSFLSLGENEGVKSWKDLRREKWCHAYRTTGKPCSCIYCTGERYNRVKFKRETKKILSLELHD